MSKGTKKLIIGIVIIILIFVIISLIYQSYQSEPIEANVAKENVLEDANTGLDNMLNQIFNNEIENTEEQSNNESTNDNNTNKNSNVQNTQSTTNEQGTEEEKIESDNHMTPRENKAIELVQEQWKKDWGSLEGVSFNVSIQSDGKYGVTVYDTTTTQTIEFYIVDVDTGVVRER